MCSRWRLSHTSESKTPNLPFSTIWSVAWALYFTSDFLPSFALIIKVLLLTLIIILEVIIIVFLLPFLIIVFVLMAFLIMIFHLSSTLSSHTLYLPRFSFPLIFLFFPINPHILNSTFSLSIRLLFRRFNQYFHLCLPPGMNSSSIFHHRIPHKTSLIYLLPYPPHLCSQGRVSPLTFKRIL